LALSNKKHKIAVLGAGSWGTALACLLANNQHQVTLWSHSEHHLKDIQEDGVNMRYLPEFPLPDNLNFDSSIQSLCDSHQVFLIVVPSRAFGSVIQAMQSAGVSEDSLIIWGTKGFDSTNQGLLSDVVATKLPNISQTGLITGPSFAKEVMSKLPTALTAGADNIDIANSISSLFHNDYVRVYANTDFIGVQIGGALKNTLAVACGISDGLGFGANARSALITRGLHEIIKLGRKMGAQTETFYGLSGLGDLVLTCTDDKSRNRRFGLGLGQGKSSGDIIEEIGQEIEAINTSKEVMLLAEKLNVELPICEQVYNIIHHNLSPKEAVSALFSRSATTE